MDNSEFHATGARAESHRALVAVMMVAALMDMIDVTIVNVALPTIGQNLRAGPSQLGWIVAGYMLTFGATLIFWGRVGDLLGRRRVFLAAVAAFGLASVAAGCASSPNFLIAARLAQGAAAGALIPQVLATFRTVIPREDRGKAFGMYGAVAGMSAALGVVLGGLLTQYDIVGLSWRAVFLINVPISVVVFAVAVRVVPQSHPTKGSRLDSIGALLLVGSIGAITFALLEGPRLGWPPWLWTLGIVGGLGMIGLLFHQRRANRAGRDCLLPPEQFRVRAFTAGVVIQALFGAGLQGFSLAFVLWLQVGHGYSPIRTGLTLLAFTVGSLITAPVAAQLAVRAGNRVLATGGVLLAIGSLLVALPAFQDRPTSFWTSCGGLVALGAGLGLLVVPLINVVLAAVPSRIAGGASGVFSTAQQIGGAVGVATIGGAFFAHAAIPGMNQGFALAAICAACVFALAAALCIALPAHAVTEDRVLETI